MREKDLKIRILLVGPSPRYPKDHFVPADEFGNPVRFPPYTQFDGTKDGSPLVFPVFKEIMEYIKKHGDVPIIPIEDWPKFSRVGIKFYE